MKILVSSTRLFDVLSEFDFKSDSIKQVRAENGCIYLDSNTKTINLYCDIFNFKARVDQNGRRWDWIKKIVSKMEDQPIVVTMLPEGNNITLMF